jgi:hypothetical protein
MPTKASVAARRNTRTHARDQLFAFDKPPARREASQQRSSGYSRTPSKRAAVVDQGPDVLMAFERVPVLPRMPEPAAAPREDDPLPRWASAEGRPPLQPIIAYVDRSGDHQRLHVAAKHGIQDQEIETNRTIEDIRKAGGTDLVVNVIATATGLTISRWRVG